VSVYQINPLQDSRWRHFLLEHPSASAFHTPSWLEALRRTYGYEPLVFTTSAPGGELTNGLLFCRINSRLTGRRLVSLPFSDHCEPLVDSPKDIEELRCSLEDLLKREHLKHIEVRPASARLEGERGFGKAKGFWFHKIDLRPSQDELFRRFHRDCVQRKIRRAQREALTYEAGRSGLLLQQFYHLLVLTRRRQQLLPQPLKWFRNLVDSLGDRINIRVASKDGWPVASILTLHYKDVLVYKYGCSDARFSQCGGIQLLFWQAIRQAKETGLLEFDLGRSDCGDPGLVAFKDRWGSSRSTLTYWRYPPPELPDPRVGWTMRMAKQMLTHIPGGFLTAAGKLLYKHVG
jgi:lipid II:glycine glycyltransferase (peptidoglycan interpeptide bridge formation enzyme)